MGFPMAGHLQKAGHSVTVYNRNAEKSAKWVATHGGASAATPREAAAGADIVLMCVGNDNDVRSVVYGDDGALAGMKAGAVLVDHTTASAALARELDAAAKAQARASSTRRCPAAGRRRERQAGHHVRRRSGHFRSGEGYAQHLRQGAGAHRRRRR